MRVVNVRGLTPNSPGVVYCGRACAGWQQSPLHNPVRKGASCPVCGRIHREPGDTLTCFRRYLWGQIKRGRLVKEILALPENAKLGCWCSPDPCHCEVILRARRWLERRGER